MNAAPPDFAPLFARADEIAVMTVFHLDDDLMSAMAIGPAQLETFEGVRQVDVTDAAAIVAVLERLRAVTLQPYAGAIDVRWGVRFSSSSGAGIGSIYAERFGIAGYVDGVAAAFDDRGAFVDYLDATYGD